MRASFCIEVIEAESRHCEMIMTRTPSGAATRLVERQPSRVVITVSIFSRSRFSSVVWSLGSQVKTLTRVAAEGSKAILSICSVLGWGAEKAPYCEDEWTIANESQNGKTFRLGFSVARRTYTDESALGEGTALR